MTLTTEKVATGTFAVLWEGKPTKYSIVNGHLGMSGRDSLNLYAIAWEKGGDLQVQRIGTLAACKKLLADKLSGRLR